MGPASTNSPFLVLPAFQGRPVREFSLEPPHKAPAGCHAAAGNLAARHQVEVKVQPLVGQRLVGHEHDVAGAAKLKQGLTVVEVQRRM